MRRLTAWLAFAAVPLLLLSAGAPIAPAAEGKPEKPRTLVTTTSPIRAFAQDEDAIAWVGRSYKVHVRSLLTGASATVGSAAPPIGPSFPVLALAGTRVLWTTYEGGNSGEVSLSTSTLGARPAGIDLFAGGQAFAGGVFLGGAAGDGPTLAYGRTPERCDDPSGNDCHRLDVVGGGVVLVTGQYQTAPIEGIPAPVLLAFAGHDPQSGAISQAMIAVAPAATPLLTDFFHAPRVAENGPVEVYRLLNQVQRVSSATPRGTVKAIALSFAQLVVLVQRADGTRAIERYNPKNGTLIGTAVVPKATAPELGIGTPGVVYRVGGRIYVLGSGRPRLVWRAGSTPVGLSIEGRRIAWASNFGAIGRIVTLTVR